MDTNFDENKFFSALDLYIQNVIQKNPKPGVNRLDLHGSDRSEIMQALDHIIRNRVVEVLDYRKKHGE